MRCKFDDPTDLLKLILATNSGHSPVDEVLSMPHDKLEALALRCIGERTGDRLRVAFFCPSEGFEGNFGDLPEELEIRGCEVLWLFGSGPAFLRSRHKNKWLIINDMARRIKGIDAIVTASVMDCLPDEPLHILHDHLSFAHFDLEGHLDKLVQTHSTSRRRLTSMRDLFNEISAFVAFLPFYDLILTPSQAVTELTLKALRFTGYRSDDACYAASENRLDPAEISHLVDVTRYRDTVTVFQSGYCKLDAPIKKYAHVPVEKIIVFAPTPNDTTGNKESPLWNSAVAVNRHGKALLQQLCQRFPDYTIAFKPYKDELPEVIVGIREGLAGTTNFQINECGSQYWDLYSRAAILISDFSSTAYTFALGIGRPVVFFSPNEASLPVEVRENTYCRSRELVGVVATTIDEVASSVTNVLEHFTEYVARVEKFRSLNFVEPGGASAAAATAIIGKLQKKEMIGTELSLGSGQSRSHFTCPSSKMA